jgi:hypothetical protein
MIPKLAAILLLASTPSAAAPEAAPGTPIGGTPPGLAVELSVSRLFGDTSYEMNAQADDPTAPGTLTDIRSELEFPLDVTRLGISVDWSPGGSTPGRWSFGAGVYTNLDDPGNRMIDEDWIGPKQFSYTESDAELDLIGGAVETRYRIREGRRATLFLLFGVDYERVEQRIVGFEGWQASLFSDQRFDVSGTVPVVDYDVTYVVPQAGVALAYAGGSHTRLLARTTGGVVYATDTDDHLRRGRVADGSGWGAGVDSRLEIALMPGLAGPLSVSLAGEFRFLFAEGDVTQRWYRSTDLPAGTEIRDLPYRFERLGAGVGLSLGVGL